MGTVESRKVVPICFRQSLTKSCRSSGERTQDIMSADMKYKNRQGFVHLRVDEPPDWNWLI